MDDETALWSAALARDERAFGILFDRHRDRVFRHALRLVDHRSEAEDVAAAAFFELWRRCEAVRIVEGSVLPRLLVTATNLCRNVARGTRRYRAMLSGFPRGEDGIDPAVVAGDRVDRAQEAERLHRAIAMLSADDAALLVLTAVEGWTAVRAAAAIGITPDAARTRLVRIRRLVRAELENEGAR
ncbi:RNA polymerase sigma factor [Amnibacterium kyonggiense]|uniref:RNA polymerase ECF family sigma subunit n=1 Tax=Amnibacterium kyonggiense TaxID=595671 RepID=A0A4V3EBB4_9MICO|nr:sigma-70 family RNA polymerase sigma factor [Amnibacterium kyonggiense]TDS81074.1 RNA polymerase ECF family sigma subunit [Amnibacterium kyonggiense]